MYGVKLGEDVELETVVELWTYGLRGTDVEPEAEDMFAGTDT